MQKVTFWICAGIMLFPALGGGRPVVGSDKPRGEAALPVRDDLQWLTVQQAQDSLKTEPKVILMDIYTDWCYWCKVMESNTYSKREVALYIKDHFYAVKFNAEDTKSINWKGQSFTFNPAYKVNELALSLTQGHLSYPTTVIVTPDNNPPQYIAGYLKPSDFEGILKYFGDGAYKTKSFKDFSKGFHNTWK
jgi:thioredoxin-related protein